MAKVMTKSELVQKLVDSNPERFTRKDARTLDYKLTIEDPKTWSKPWTIEFPLKSDPKYTLFEYACHEGNYYMYNALTGSQASNEGGRK